MTTEEFAALLVLAPRGVGVASKASGIAYMLWFDRVTANCSRPPRCG